MSVNVYNFNEKSGVANVEKYGRKYTLNLYALGQSNCFIAAIYEYQTEDGTTMYDYCWHIDDELQAKKCFGLAKNRNGKIENVFADEIKGITLYRNRCKQWQKIRSIFRQAFGPDFPIEIRMEE